MENTENSSKITFKEQEKLFIEKTGTRFEDMYTKQRPKLVMFINRICQDVEKSEDIASDSMLKALDKIESFDQTKASFVTWLYTIARNEANQDYNKKMRNYTLSLDAQYKDASIMDFIAEEDSFTMEHEANMLKAQVIISEIPNLKKKHREVIEMRELKNMSYRDIQNALSITHESTLKSRIRIGRQELIRKTEERFLQIDNRIYETIY